MAIAERIPSYRPPIPDELRHQYEGALADVARWQTQMLPPNEPENDLQHVRRMHVILDEMSQRSPSIAREVDLETVGHMIYIHDGGEIVSRDLSRADPNYDNLRAKHKRKERLGFSLIVAGQIEDPDLRGYVRHLYKRTEAKGLADKEAQLTDFIDKVQAVRFGLEHVYHGNMLGKPDNQRTRARRSQQVNFSIGILMSPTLNLFNALESFGARRDFKDFAIGEVGRFLAHGYTKNEIKPYIETLYPLNPSPVARRA